MPGASPGRYLYSGLNELLPDRFRSMNLVRLHRGKLLLSIVFGVLVMLGLLIFGDYQQTIAALSQFRLEFLPVIIGLTLLNYALRFVKWHYYIRLLGATSVSRVDSMLIFLTGMSMTVTPGKVGELLKIGLLSSASGISFTRIAPILVAERMTDGLALLLLASGGIVVFGLGWEVLVGTLALSAVVIGLSQVRPLALWVLGLGERLPVINTKVHLLREFYEGSFTLFRGFPLFIAILLGTISWAGECLAFFFVLVALGVEPSMMLVLQSAFILAVSTLAGAFLLTPGGLGVAEGGIAGLTRFLVGTTNEVAAAATIIIRICTLWFGVLVGAIALAIYTSRTHNDTVITPGEVPVA